MRRGPAGSAGSNESLNGSVRVTVSPAAACAARTYAPSTWA